MTKFCISHFNDLYLQFLSFMIHVIITAEILVTNPVTNNNTQKYLYTTIYKFRTKKGLLFHKWLPFIQLIRKLLSRALLGEERNRSQYMYIFAMLTLVDSRTKNYNTEKLKKKNKKFRVVYFNAMKLGVSL